jgi:hypothetical protein
VLRLTLQRRSETNKKTAASLPFCIEAKSGVAAVRGDDFRHFFSLSGHLHLTVSIFHQLQAVARCLSIR